MTATPASASSAGHVDTCGVRFPRLSGTLQRSNLVLSFPQQNGQLAAVQFNPSGVAAYNTAVTTLQNEAYRTLAAQQAAAATAAAQAKKQQAIANPAQAVSPDHSRGSLRIDCRSRLRPAGGIAGRFR